MLSIIVFLFVFSVMVTIHEWGHYYVAKKSGVLVREFALGMGPKVASWQKGETTFTIRLLPLGGFVRMAGDGDDVEEIKPGQLIYVTQNEEGIVTVIDTQEQPDNALALPVDVVECDIVNDMMIKGRVGIQGDVQLFRVSRQATHIERDGTHVQVAPIETHLESVSALKRIAIYVAGPLSNFVLSVAVFTLLAFATGGINSSTNQVTVQENSAAAQAGIQTGDIITAINGKHVTEYSDISTTMRGLREQNVTEVTITFRTQGVEKTQKVTLVDGYLGVSPVQETRLTAKLTAGFTQTWDVIKQVWLALVGMLTGGLSMSQMGGPIAIVQASGQVAQFGFLPILSFLAMLSANLGVMNLVPIPGLDGGKIVFALIEMIRGKRLSKQKEMVVTIVGVALLLLLMVTVTFNDITRLLNR